MNTSIMTIDTDKIKKLSDTIKTTQRLYSGDNLRLFMLNPLIEELEALKSKSFPVLVAACKKFGVRYIKVDPDEICGCEDVKDGTWPAMWTIAKITGIAGGCGNSDQYQTKHGQWFLAEDYGFWDMHEGRKLSIEEYSVMKFNAVVSR